MPVVLVYVFAALSLVGLTWDGAGYVFSSLQNGAPEIAHHRYSNLALLWPAVWVGNALGDPRAAAVVYGLLLACVPLGALWLSFRLLSDSEWRALRVWPLFGILLGALPGEICLVSEASLAVQVGWVLVAFVLAGFPRWGIPWVALASVFLFFLHPTAAVIFGGVVLLIGLVAVVLPRVRKGAAIWAPVFVVLGVARVVFSLMTASPYERAEFGWEANLGAAQGAFAGSPGVVCLFIAIAAVGCFFIGSYRRWKVAKPLILAGFAGVLVVGCQWAFTAQLWAGAIGYRRFVLLCSLPLVVMAFVHWVRLRRRLDRDGGELARWTLVGIAWVFAIVFGVQVAVWRGEVARLEQALQGAQSKVITLEEVPWARKTALDHWGATMLSVVIQGREPKTIFLLDRANLRGDHAELFPDGRIGFEKKWFNLSPFSGTH